MLCLYYDLNNAKVQYLLQTDEKLSKLIRYIGDSELVIEDNGFKLKNTTKQTISKIAQPKSIFVSK